MGTRSEPYVKLELFFGTGIASFDIVLVSTNPGASTDTGDSNPTARFKETVDVPLESVHDLGFYCDKIKYSFATATWDGVDLNWMDDVTEERYDALIEKVVFAALQKMKNRLNSHPKDACQEPH